MAKRRWNVIEPEARRLRRAGCSWPEVANAVSRLAGEKVEASTLRKRLNAAPEVAAPPRADSALARAERIIAAARRSPEWAEAMVPDGYVGAVAALGTPEQKAALRVLRIPSELATALQLVVLEPDDDPANEETRVVALKERAIALIDEVKGDLEASLALRGMTEDELDELLAEARKQVPSKPATSPKNKRPASKPGKRS